jgi:hypothetical protein
MKFHRNAQQKTAAVRRLFVGVVLDLYYGRITTADMEMVKLPDKKALTKRIKKSCTDLETQD